METEWKHEESSSRNDLARGLSDPSERAPVRAWSMRHRRRGTLAPVTTSMDRSARLRVVAGAALLVLSAPCLILGLPGVLLAAALVVGATPSGKRGPVMLLCALAFTTWWPASWCLVDARLAPTEAALLLAAITCFAFAIAPLVLAPIAIAAGASGLADALAHPASRRPAVRGSVAILTLAAFAPPTLLSPLVGYLSGASALALGLSFGIPHALRAHASKDPTQVGDVSDAAKGPDRPAVALALALVVVGLSALGVLSLPSDPKPGPLGPDGRSFDGPLREGPVLVTPHDEGFVVSVADGGGAGLVSTPFGRPDRVSIHLEHREERREPRAAASLRVCAARDEASVCTWIDRDGVRLDDGPLDRASSAYGTTGLALLACIATLLLALALLGTRRPLATPLVLASIGALLALAAMPWW